MIGRAAAPTTAPAMIHHHERPAMKIAINPATATSVAVPVADLAKGVNVAIPRGFNKRYLKAKVKAVSGTFTDGTVQAWVDTFVGK